MSRTSLPWLVVCLAIITASGAILLRSSREGQGCCTDSVQVQIAQVATRLEAMEERLGSWERLVLSKIGTGARTVGGDGSRRRRGTELARDAEAAVDPDASGPLAGEEPVGEPGDFLSRSDLTSGELGWVERSELLGLRFGKNATFFRGNNGCLGAVEIQIAGDEGPLGSAEIPPESRQEICDLLVATDRARRRAFDRLVAVASPVFATHAEAVERKRDDPDATSHLLIYPGRGGFVLLDMREHDADADLGHAREALDAKKKQLGAECRVAWRGTR